jgi:radical SAM superfamily enzyme YgiQ (UPF0313 family)
MDHVRHNEVLPLETSRGCLFKCKFCSFPLLGRSKTDPAYKKLQNKLTEEIVYNYEKFGITKYVIVDDTFNETTEKLESIAKSIADSGVKLQFFAYLRIDLLYRFPEQIKLLKDMGLRSAFFGIETLNWESAKAIGKGLHPDKIKEILATLKTEWGKEVSMYSSFICGLPHETPETFREWTDWIVNESPLDSWSCFQWVCEPPEERGEWASEFVKNPKDHGYEILWSEHYKTWYWRNQHWDSLKAFYATKEFLKKNGSSPPA